MGAPIFEQNRAYRKGLLLGFTMAEISILIIFSLLLATAFVTKKKNYQIHELKKKNSELAEIKKIMDQYSIPYNKKDEYFQEIKRIKEQASQVERLQKESIELKEIKQLLTNGSGHNSSIKSTVNKIRRDAEFARELKAHLIGDLKKNTSAKSLATLINTSQNDFKLINEKKMRAVIETERLKGQLANAQKKLTSLGKGTEMPACWANPTTGKPEYIFKINLTGNGLVIYDQKLPHRISDQKLLPLKGIYFNHSLDPKEFLKQTSQLSKWSISHNCRFFVLTQDNTGTNQKEIYKIMLRALEAHFYKYEIL